MARNHNAQQNKLYSNSWIQFNSFIYVLDNSKPRPITAKHNNSIRYFSVLINGRMTNYRYSAENIKISKNNSNKQQTIIIILHKKLMKD
jgi:hypothetical protein